MHVLSIGTRPLIDRISAQKQNALGAQKRRRDPLRNQSAKSAYRTTTFATSRRPQTTGNFAAAAGKSLKLH
jgi:hypothetical protein